MTGSNPLGGGGSSGDSGGSSGGFMSSLFGWFSSMSEGEAKLAEINAISEQQRLNRQSQKQKEGQTELFIIAALMLFLIGLLVLLKFLKK